MVGGGLAPQNPENHKTVIFWGQIQALKSGGIMAEIVPVFVVGFVCAFIVESVPVFVVMPAPEFVAAPAPGFALASVCSTVPLKALRPDHRCVTTAH